MAVTPFLNLYRMIQSFYSYLTKNRWLNNIVALVYYIIVVTTHKQVGRFVAQNFDRPLGRDNYNLAVTEDLSGLQAYHKSINLTSLLSGVSGIGLIVFGFMRHKVSTIEIIIYSLIMGISVLAVFSHWVSKNSIESKSLYPKTLISGTGSGLDIGNSNTINRNYRNSM